MLTIYDFTDNKCVLTAWLDPPPPFNKGEGWIFQKLSHLEWGGPKNFASREG